VDFLKELAAIAEKNGGIIENKTALDYGISRAMLSKLYSTGVIHRISRGQYVLADEMQDELLALSRRSQYIIFSHETALFLHGISDRVPFEHTVTIPSDRVLANSLREECKVYYIKRELFGLGKTTLPTPAGNQVPVYDLERTICDIVRSRNKIGTETFLAALKAYAANPKKDLNRLNAYAKQMRLSNIIRKYLEVLL
jgi:predicted transcriptional regulator of viral defense system